MGAPPPTRSPAIGLEGLIHQIVQIPEGDLAVPVQLDPTIIRLRSRLKPGLEAPAFDVPALEEGKSIKLSDYKGKVVLLDFWATWCGPCKEQLPHLKRVYERFGNDPRFVMIGLSLDTSREPLQKYIEQEKLGWIHGFLGSWDQTKVPEAYGVYGIPAVFLVGPDGRVISPQLYGESIERYVSEALSRLPR